LTIFSTSDILYNISPFFGGYEIQVPAFTGVESIAHLFNFTGFQFFAYCSCVKLEGLVTERDLVRKVCINDIRTRTVTNKEIMSSPLITIDSNSSPSIAAHMMLQTNVKHLLVVDKSNVITPVDLRYAVLYTDEEVKAAIEKLSEGGPPN